MADPTQATELLNIAEAASFFKRSQRWVYRRIKDGEIPASKIGGLYFIRRADLQALVDQGRIPSSTDKVTGTLSTADAFSEPQKCGYCFRILDDSQIAGVCRAEGCSELICTRCQAEGVQHCARHFPSREQRWEEAQAAYEQGKLPVLLKANHARLLEMNYLNRIRERLGRFNSLLHPTSGELIHIPDWDAVCEAGDQRSEIMRLLGKVALETSITASTPLNAWMDFRLPPGRGKKEPSLELQVHVLSHLPEMVRGGFDSRPFDLEDLLPWVQRLAEESAASGVFTIYLLAASTGWDASARQAVLGKSTTGRLGAALVQRLGLIYLYDLQSGELLHNPLDERARRYAELFGTLTPGEELAEAVKAVEKELVVHDSITLQYACQVLPYPPRLLRQAFDELVKTGHYAFLEVPQLGLSIIRTGV